MSRGDYSSAATMIKRSGKPTTFTDADLEKYKAAWRNEGALTGMINWYRAYVQKPPTLPDNVRLSMPTLMIWGAKDQFLSASMAQPSIEMCDDGNGETETNPNNYLGLFYAKTLIKDRLDFKSSLHKLVMIEDATHWVQHDAPERVNGLLLDFLRKG